MRKVTFLSSFILKVVALITMAIDHVGMVLRMMYPYNDFIRELSNVFRCIGRLALSLFVFMIVEGVIHTKNFKGYLIRLGAMAGLISVAFIVMQYTPVRQYTYGLLRAGNIFIDLSLVAISVYLLRSKEIWKKCLTLLPLAFSIVSFVVKGYEYAHPNVNILWFPEFITMQYDWFSVVLGVGFYFAYALADAYIKGIEKYTGMGKDIYEANGDYRIIVNVISFAILMIVSGLYYAMKYIWPEGVFWSVDIQLLAIISGALILLYNGKRGYNAKWFQYGSYLFYPLHLAVIAIVIFIINGGL